MTGKLTKSGSKIIKSLQQKKYREEQGSFVVEGVKMVLEALNSDAEVETLVYTDEIQGLIPEYQTEVYKVSSKELSMISSLKTPNKVLAVCKFRKTKPVDFSVPLIFLDDVKDPGNLGTIIRIADWFGYKQILCSKNTVDLYNPKVVQATMGSIFRVDIQYVEPEEFMDSLPSDYPLLIADMEGESIYTIPVPKRYALALGSESHGLNANLRRRAAKAISIPQIGGGESLNVAVSTAVIASWLTRP